MVSTRVDFLAGNAGTVSAELFLPGAPGRHPSIIVVHEWWGLNEDMRRIAGRLAGEGFLALAVDLYGGRSTTRSEEALALAQEMKTPLSMEIIEAAAGFLRGHARGTGRVGVTGFCLGGAMALAAAMNTSVDACAPFYGIPLPQHADYSRVRAPIQGHYGKHDGSIPVEKPKAMEAAVRAAGGDVELHLYEAGHAFMRESDPKVYDEASAKLAWQRLVAFFRERLA